MSDSKKILNTMEREVDLAGAYIGHIKNASERKKLKARKAK